MTDAREPVAANNPRPPQLAGSLALRLFLMLRYLHDQGQRDAHIDAHLDWMIAQEQRGAIFLSGPFGRRAAPGELSGATVLRADSIAEARRIADADPFVRSGFVRYELHEWTAFEGSLNLQVTLSGGAGRVI